MADLVWGMQASSPSPCIPVWLMKGSFPLWKGVFDPEGKDPESNEEEGCVRGRRKKQEKTVTAERVQSGLCTRVVNSPEMFLWTFLHLFLNSAQPPTVTASSHSCVHGTLPVYQVARAHSGTRVHIAETRKSWYSYSNISSEPYLMCPRSYSPQKAIGYFQRHSKPAL